MPRSKRDVPPRTHASAHHKAATQAAAGRELAGVKVGAARMVEARKEVRVTAERAAVEVEAGEEKPEALAMIALAIINASEERVRIVIPVDRR
mmetsp:Transcript_18925/g.29859  ORF Transcript_18925/g.29859 Transcript_18925/m.29859 type:complete len:93 (+) Transcript_18925:404-682(+)